MFTLQALSTLLFFISAPTHGQVQVSYEIKNPALFRQGKHALVTAGGFEPPTLRAEI